MTSASPSRISCTRSQQQLYPISQYLFITAFTITHCVLPAHPLWPYDVLIHLYRGGFLCTLYSWRPFTVSFQGGELNEFQHHVGNIVFRCGHWQSVTYPMHNEKCVFASYFVSVDYATTLEILSFYCRFLETKIRRGSML